MSNIPQLGYLKTQRGFQKICFWDEYAEQCSLQKSSWAEGDAVWLGLDAPQPKILASRLQEGLTGWLPYPLPGDVFISGRMHLTREHVKALLPILQHFAETGELPEEEPQ